MRLSQRLSRLPQSAGKVFRPDRETDYPSPYVIRLGESLSLREETISDALRASVRIDHE